ncbi:MAG TPA: type II toxin-antitoxin system mRNA interferase toxin, RelE/StbE family [Methanophagales archaeon]|nr:type II toxin-antitoxin system mRNA interferase toxin, RelE/StbE family [Methanophagales archaeon]
MAEYEITLASSTEREIQALPKSVQRRVEKMIDSLRINPRPRGTIKLKGREGIYRIRVGDYRIIYTINDKKRLVDVSYVRHRSRAYF